MKVEQRINGKLKEAISLKLVRPPVEKRGKREMPQKLPGKPLSEYVKEVRN
ncbi:MAG: hypothetical protein ACK4WF_09190 [Candidatus Brocadiales bacterium]